MVVKFIRKMAEDEWKKNLQNLRMTRYDFLELLSLKEPFFLERSDAVRKDTLSLDKKARTYTILLEGSGIVFDDIQYLWLLKSYYLFRC